MPPSQPEKMLSFEGGGSCPVQYFVDFASHEYYVRYRCGILEVTRTPIGTQDEHTVLDCRLGDTYDGYWNARETNVYLSLINNSIRSDRFDADQYPHKDRVRDHSFYQLGPFPVYPVGLFCGVQEKPPPPDNPRMNRHDRKKRRKQDIHDHDLQCRAFVAAQDVALWIVNHPSEHQALKKVYPELWRQVAKDLEIDTSP